MIFLTGNFHVVDGHYLLDDMTIHLPEIFDFRITSLKINSVPSIHVHRKAYKERSVSPRDSIVSHLKKYFYLDAFSKQPLDYTKINGTIARMFLKNVVKIINQYAEKIRVKQPELLLHLHGHI